MNVFNSLECKISCSNSKVSYVLDTEDVFHRKSAAHVTDVIRGKLQRHQVVGRKSKRASDLFKRYLGEKMASDDPKALNEKQFAHHSGEEALHLHVNSNAAITAAADHDGPGSHAFGALPDFQVERERTKNLERNYVTEPSKETDVQTLDTDTACFEHVSPSPRVGNDMDLLSSKEHGHITHAMHDFAAE